VILRQSSNKLSPALIVSGTLFCLLLFYLPLAHGAVETGASTIMHLVTVLIVALWIVPMVNDNNINYYRTPFDLPALLLILIIIISIYLSVYPYASRIHTYKIINYLLIGSFLMNNTSRKQYLIRLVWAIVIFGGVYAIAALFLLKGNFLGYKIFSLEQHHITFTFVNHNHFAGFLELVIWLCIGLVLSSSGIKRLCFVILGICIAVAILFTLSRGGIIGVSGGLILFCVMSAHYRRAKKSILLLMAFLAVVLFTVSMLGGFDRVFERMGTLKTPAITGESRFGIWKDTINIIKNNLWIGTGIGTFKYIYPKYQTESVKFAFNHAHNSYLELTSEIGIIGIVCFFSIIVILFAVVIRRLDFQHDKQLQAIGIGSLSGCFSLLIHEVTDFNLYIPSNAFLFTVCASISFISAHINISKPYNSKYCRLSDKKKSITLFAIISLCILSLMAVLSPFIGNFYYKIAKEEERLKEYDNAYEALRIAKTVDFGNAEYMASLGDLMAVKAEKADNQTEKEKSYFISLMHYDNAIAACPVKSYYYTKKAFSLMRLNKRKEAEDAFNKAVYFSPFDSSNYLNLGTFYLDKGDLNKAYLKYKEALLIDGSYLVTVLDLIWTISPYYDSLSMAVPETVELREKFANYLFIKGLSDAAKKELSFASSLEPTGEVTASVTEKLVNKYIKGSDIQTAEMYARAGKYEEAISIYNRLITKYRYSQESTGRFQQLFNNESNSQFLYTELASLYSKMGRHEEAINTLQEWITQWPDDKKNRPAYLYVILAGLYDKTENYQEAINTLKEAVKEWPDDKKLSLSLKREMAENYNRQGQYDKAIPLYRQLIDEEDKPWAYLYHILAGLYDKTENYQEAINTLKEAVKEWPDDRKLSLALKREMAENYNRQGQYDKAIPLYRQLIDEEDKPWAYLSLKLATLYSKTGQHQLAIYTLQEAIKQWPDSLSLRQQLENEYKVTERPK
jgi:tetratricopeptide (TPR) repeat protein